MNNMNYTMLSDVDVKETLLDTDHILGVDEYGDIVKTPKFTLGKVKTVNNIEPDETGNVTVETGGVKTINGIVPDEAGNVNVDVGVGGVKTVNGETPDENGNIDIKTGGSGSVKSVNNRYSDDKGNIDVCAELADVGNNVFVPTKPTYAYYADTKTDNGAPQPDFTMFSEGDSSIVYLHVEDEVYESPVGDLYVSYPYMDTATNTLYKGFGNYNIINSDAPDNGDSYVCCTYKTYSGQVHNSEVIDSGVKVLFRDGIERSYCIKIGRYRTNKIPESLLPDNIGKSFVGVKTINNRYPDANYNVNICQALANVGYNVFVPTRPTYAYYADCDCDNGVEMINPDNISHDEIIRIMFDGTVYEFKGSERKSYNHAAYPDYENVYGYGNFSIIDADDGDTGAPDTREPFVYYYGEYSGVDFRWVNYYTEKHSFSIEIGKYQYNKIHKYLLDDSIVEAAENSVKTINDQTPDGTGNIDVCKALMNLGDVLEDEEVIIPRCFAQGSDTLVGDYYLDERYGAIGKDPSFPEITDEFVYRIIFDDQIYDFNSDDIHHYSFSMEEYAHYFGNPSLMPETDDEEFGDTPGADNGMPFVYYVRAEHGRPGIYAYVVVKDEEKHTFKLSVGKPTVNKIPEELLPESVIVIDCPEFNGQKSIPCETLGGYTIAEMQDYLRNDGFIKIKRDMYEPDSGGSLQYRTTIFYESTGYCYEASGGYLESIIFSATYSNANVYIGETDGVVYCNEPVVTTKNLIWVHNTLVDDYKKETTNDE